MMGSAGSFAVGLFLLVLPSVAASLPSDATIGDPSPHAPNAVRASYETNVLETMDGFDVGVELRVHEIEFPPAGGRTAMELRAAPAPLQSIFEEFVRGAVLDEAARVLPEADVQLASFAVDYAAEDHDADPYEPPVTIRALVQASFTPAFFGLPPATQASGQELARALLYSGGSYRVAKDLDVPAGFTVDHALSVPSFLELQEPGARPVGRLLYGADNLEGSEPQRLNLDFGLQLRHPAIPENVLAGPLVRALFVIDDETPVWKQSLPFLGGDYRGHLDLDIQVHSLEVDLFGAYPLPRQVELHHVSADLLRIAIREGLVLRGDIETFFEDLIRRSLVEGFGEDIRLDLDWQALSASLNEAVGGRDGQSVTPLIIRARADLPFASNKMLVSSSLGRLVAMTVGTSGEFELANDGIWNAHYTVAYPKGVHVNVRDSAGLTTDKNWGEREGFEIDLSRGAATRVHVEGRSDYDAAVFAIGLAEIAILALVLVVGVRYLRGALRGKTAPKIA